MTKTIEDLFVYCAYGADILVIVLLLSLYKYWKQDKSIWVILTYCAFALVFNQIVETVKMPNKAKYLLYDFFTLAEYSLFAFFLWLNISNHLLKRVILIATVAFTVFLGVYFTTVQFRSIDSVPIGVETILILIYSFYYLYEQMNDTNNLFVYNKHSFWITSGIMLYLAGSFFIYIFANQVDKAILSQYWIFTNVFYIIKNLFFVIAILILLKQKKNPSPEKLYPYLN